MTLIYDTSQIIVVNGTVGMISNKFVEITFFFIACVPTGKLSLHKAVTVDPLYEH